MDCTVRVAKTKALISFVVTGKLICVFGFAYAKNRFSHDAAHLRASQIWSHAFFIEKFNGRTWDYITGVTRDLLLYNK